MHGNIFFNGILGITRPTCTHHDKKVEFDCIYKTIILPQVATMPMSDYQDTCT